MSESIRAPYSFMNILGLNNANAGKKVAVYKAKRTSCLQSLLPGQMMYKFP
ncbi:MAG: hypothetical protein Q7V19_03635 [Bacteroidales bacterium]|nr:hypothetical protein [Bacteroidales bacterium]